MKIAYLSPLNPMKSGISDFSEELIMELKKYITIDLYVDGYKPVNAVIKENFKILNINDLVEYASEYDLIIYHIGNNHKYHEKIVEAFLKYGGIIELHDVSLHHYLAADTLQKNMPEKYLELMEYSHGEKGRRQAELYLAGKSSPLWENRSLEFTVNKHLVDNAKAVIVHSDMAKQMVKVIRPSVPVVNIPLHSCIPKIDLNEMKNNNRIELGISLDDIIIGSFGFASKEKRIVQILEALKIYKDKKKRDFKYYIVGELTDKDIIKKINELGLKNNVVVTGYTDLILFEKYMSTCDFCLNLRYPTQGESSASLHRMIGMGKPVIVTDVGTFSEYPDDIALKVRYDSNEVNDIYSALCFLTGKNGKIKEIGTEAKKYAESNFSLVENAKKYNDFFFNLVNGDYIELDYLDVWLDRVFELGIAENFQLHALIEKIKSIY